MKVTGDEGRDECAVMNKGGGRKESDGQKGKLNVWG